MDVLSISGSKGVVEKNRNQQTAYAQGAKQWSYLRKEQNDQVLYRVRAISGVEAQGRHLFTSDPHQNLIVDIV